MAENVKIGLIVYAARVVCSSFVVFLYFFWGIILKKII